MSGFDISDELRINWDENRDTKFPFFSASAGYTAKSVLELVRKRADQHRDRANALDEWVCAYERIALELRRDQHPKVQPAKKPRPYVRKKSPHEAG